MANIFNIIILLSYIICFSNFSLVFCSSDSLVVSWSSSFLTRIPRLPFISPTSIKAMGKKKRISSPHIFPNQLP